MSESPNWGWKEVVIAISLMIPAMLLPTLPKRCRLARPKPKRDLPAGLTGLLPPSVPCCA